MLDHHVIVMIEFLFRDRSDDPHFKCRMFPSLQTAERTGYTSMELENFGYQKGSPKPRMGHSLHMIMGPSDSHFLVLVGGHTKGQHPKK